MFTPTYTDSLSELVTAILFVLISFFVSVVIWSVAPSAFPWVIIDAPMRYYFEVPVL